MSRSRSDEIIGTIESPMSIEDAKELGLSIVEAKEIEEEQDKEE